MSKRREPLSVQEAKQQRLHHTVGQVTLLGRSHCRAVLRLSYRCLEGLTLTTAVSPALSELIHA